MARIEKEHLVQYEKVTGSKRKRDQNIERIYFEWVRSGTWILFFVPVFPFEFVPAGRLDQRPSVLFKKPSSSDGVQMVTL
ncbi:uncharacterized protein [Periplaneta americana]|uniref:uncharacterized protein isoform X2 n=1 Tax=Periplaneta americana TaxID=6978 RepID=UPI0037E9977E